MLAVQPTPVHRLPMTASMSHYGHTVKVEVTPSPFSYSSSSSPRNRPKLRHLDSTLSSVSRLGRKQTEGSGYCHCEIRSHSASADEAPFLRKTIDMSDLAEIYRTPGLFEVLFRRVLRSPTPAMLAQLFNEETKQEGVESLEDIRMLDLGAGNGIVSQQFQELGVGYIHGIDMMHEAKMAADRDRPEVFDQYDVVPLQSAPFNAAKIEMPPSSPLGDLRLEPGSYNLLTCASSMGPDDTPPQAFTAAFNLLAPEAWIAFTIRDTFLGGRDTSGFALFIGRCQRAGIMEFKAHQRFRHMIEADGKPTYCIAFVARKVKNISLRWLDLSAVSP